MQRIAVFIDIDNTDIDFDTYNMILDSIGQEGVIVYGKVYGVVDRKHKSIIDKAVEKGFYFQPPMRVKKRGSRIFDSRIFVDVMDVVCNNSTIDMVAIVSAPTDLVHLFSKLREFGIGIMSYGNLDEESMFFVDYKIEVDDLNDLDIDELSLSKDLINEISSIQNEKTTLAIKQEPTLTNATDNQKQEKPTIAKTETKVESNDDAEDEDDMQINDIDSFDILANMEKEFKKL